MERQRNQNSGNASQPPSRDQKANRPAKVRRHRGANVGHAKAVRVLTDYAGSAPHPYLFTNDAAAYAARR